MKLHQQDREELIIYLEKNQYRTNETAALCQIEQIFWLYEGEERRERLQQIENKRRA